MPPRPTAGSDGQASLLAGMAVAIHLFGAIPAYDHRNQDDSRMIRSVVDSRERLIVVDDPFTAQMLLPLYYRRIVLLADSDELRESSARAWRPNGRRA